MERAELNDLRKNVLIRFLMLMILNRNRNPC